MVRKKIKREKDHIGHKSPQKRLLTKEQWKNVWVVLFIILVVVLVFAWWKMHLKSGSPDADDVRYLKTSKNVENIGEPVLKIERARFEGFGEWECIKGDIENISGKPISYIKIILTLKDKKGGLIDFSSGYAMGQITLHPNEVRQFQRCMENKDSKISVEESSISFSGKIGDDFEDAPLPYRMK